MEAWWKLIERKYNRQPVGPCQSGAKLVERCAAKRKRNGPDEAPMRPFEWHKGAVRTLQWNRERSDW